VLCICLARYPFSDWLIHGASSLRGGGEQRNGSIEQQQGRKSTYDGAPIELKLVVSSPCRKSTVTVHTLALERQPTFTPCYPRIPHPESRTLVTVVTFDPLFARAQFYMLEMGRLETFPEMSPLRHFEDQRRKTWCAVVVLAAVCSLTVSVATRYSSSWDVSAPTVKTVQAHAKPEAKRQRLDKDAANWVPPLVGFDALRSPSSYRQTTPAEPPTRNVFLEESLFNRPPPSSEFLS
jgi:hypothetical protein